MERAAAAPNQGHQGGEQSPAEFFRLLRPLERVGDFRNAGLDPALTLGLLNTDMVLFHRTGQLPDFGGVLLMTNSGASFTGNQAAQTEIQVRQGIDDMPPIKQQERAYH